MHSLDVVGGQHIYATEDLQKMFRMCPAVLDFFKTNLHILSNLPRSISTLPGERITNRF